MSKSRGNVINPDEMIEKYGADALRLYEMFMGPLEQSKSWSMDGIEGSKRFLDRVYRLYDEEEYIKKYTTENDHKLDYVYHYSVKKITSDYENLTFNTAISQMMIFINEVYKQEKIYLPYLEGFAQLIAPMCPHFGNEIWQKLHHQEIIDFVPWPTYDEAILVQQKISIAVQICGKVREVIEIDANSSEKEIEEIALNHPGIKARLEGKQIKKIIVIKGKIVNIVAM
jgi:leucyl-tRNA synthetase